MLKIDSSQVIFEMNRTNEPVATAKSGETVQFETLDCFSNTVQTPQDTISEIDFSKVNPATGPLFVEGAEVGDTLKVTIKKIEVEDQGAAVTAPGMGALADFVEQEQTVIGNVQDEGADYLGYPLPKRVMIGVIGTAPAGEGVNTGTPDAHGGNMDTLLVREGATLYLPVNTPGALLAMGDLHAAMGDGEIMGSGLEVPGVVTVQVDVLKDADLPLPFLETEDLYVTIASDASMEEASRMAVKHMADFIQSQTELTLNEAGMMLSLTGDLRVGQIVNPNKTMRMELPKAVLDAKK